MGFLDDTEENSTHKNGIDCYCYGFSVRKSEVTKRELSYKIPQIVGKSHINRVQRTY